MQMDSFARELFDSGYDSGYKRGLGDGIALALYNAVADGVLSPHYAADKLNISLNQLRDEMESAGLANPGEPQEVQNALREPLGTAFVR